MRRQQNSPLPPPKGRSGKPSRRLATGDLPAAIRQQKDDLFSADTQGENLLQADGSPAIALAVGPMNPAPGMPTHAYRAGVTFYPQPIEACGIPKKCYQRLRDAREESNQ
jgi:hypothetical protein